MNRLLPFARVQLRRLTLWWPALTMHVAMGSMFLCLAILLGALSGVVGGFTWVLAWPAFSLVVVGLGYVWLGPWVLGKQADGTLAWYTALLLMPYFRAARTPAPFGEPNPVTGSQPAIEFQRPLPPLVMSFSAVAAWLYNRSLTKPTFLSSFSLINAMRPAHSGAAALVPPRTTFEPSMRTL